MASQKERLPFKDFVASLRWVLSMYWEIDAVLLVLLFIGNIVRGVQFLANSYILARSVDILIAGTVDTLFETLRPIAYMLLGYWILTSILNRLTMYAERILSRITYAEMNYFLSRKLHTLGISSLENSKTNNLIARSEQHVGYMYNQLANLTSIVGILAGTIGAVLVLATVPITIPIIIVATLPQLFVDRSFLKKLWAHDKETTESRRKAYTSAGYLTDPVSMKELLISNASDFFAQKYKQFVDTYYGFHRVLRRRWYTAITILDIILWTPAIIASYGFIFVQYLQRLISIGDVTFLTRSVSQLSSNLINLTNTFNNTYESAQRISELKQLFDMKPAIEEGTHDISFETPPDITLTDVTFAYPGASKPTLKNINLSIRSGENIAIVGHNGAGKTTLIKLLCRFYTASSGTIMVGDTDITNLNSESWYKHLGVLFQEYNSYGHLTVKENISVGQPDVKPSLQRIKKAAQKADADSFIQDFDKKYDQTLSERYKGGVRPSTGQWQKLAIARFFYRDAPVVIFDEPTAAIDAIAEHKIFNRIYRFFKKKTVIIISHRFSTVRNADRIIVLDKGRIVEEGNHEALMKMDGLYAKSFKLQAKGYE